MNEGRSVFGRLAQRTLQTCVRGLVQAVIAVAGVPLFVASLLSVLSLTTLYNISVPVRTPWRRDLPGALLTLVIWFFGSYRKLTTAQGVEGIFGNALTGTC